MLLHSLKVVILSMINRNKKQKSWDKSPAFKLNRDHISTATMPRKDTNTNTIELEIISFEGLPTKISKL
jgi:hypothetical protein